MGGSVDSLTKFAAPANHKIPLNRRAVAQWCGNTPQLAETLAVVRHWRATCLAEALTPRAGNTLNAASPRSDHAGYYSPHWARLVCTSCTTFAVGAATAKHAPARKQVQCARPTPLLPSAQPGEAAPELRSGHGIG
jgi:hypothetical protein